MINLTALPLLAAGMCACIVAALLYQFFPLDLDTGRDARKTRAMLRHEVAGARAHLPFWRALLLPLQPLMKHIPGVNLTAVDGQLFWLQLDGQWTSWTAEEIWAVRLAGAVAGSLIGLLQPPGLLRILPAVILFLLPGQMLSTAYEKTSRRVRRELPEFAQSIALQAAIGKGVLEALTNLLEADTSLSRFFGWAMATCPKGTPVLNPHIDDPQPGWIVRQAQTAGLREVISLAVRVEQVARRGVEVDLLLNDVAELAASDYNAEVAARAQQLDNQLSVPLTLGLFFPYIALLILPFVSSLNALMQ